MHYIFAITIFAVGLSLCAGGIHTIRHASAFARTASRAAGTVTGFRERHSRTHGTASASTPIGDISGGGWGGGWGGMSMPTTLYFPIVRFQTDDGREIETETMYGSSLRSVKPGQPVIVLYDPTDPTRAALQGTHRSGRLLGAGMIAIGIGASFAGLFAVAFVRAITTLVPSA